MKATPSNLRFAATSAFPAVSESDQANSNSLEAQLKRILEVIGQAGVVHLIKEAEATLKSLIESEPEQVVLILLKIAMTSPEQISRMLANILLRSRYLQSSSKSCLWSKLSQDAQTQIKVELLNLLYSESIRNVKRMISHSISLLAITLLRCNDNNSSNNSNWPEFLPYLWELFKQVDPAYHTYAFSIIKNLIEEASSVFDNTHNKLLELFECGLNTATANSVKEECIEAIGACAGKMDAAFTRQLRKFVPQIVGIFTQSLRGIEPTIQLEPILLVLKQIASIEPSILKPHYQLLFDTFSQAVLGESLSIEPIEKQISTDFLLTFIENLPSLIRISKSDTSEEQEEEEKQANQISTLVEMIFAVMLSTEADISSDFLSPPPGLNSQLLEQNTSMEFIVVGMKSINRILTSIGKSNVLPILTKKIQSLLEQPSHDWRNQGIAYFALSEESDFINEKEEVKAIIRNRIVPTLTSKDHLIKFAGLHALMKFAKRNSQGFLQDSKSDVVTLLLSELTAASSSPRVTAESLKVITAITYHCSEEEVLCELLEKGYYEQLKTIFGATDFSFVKEHAVNAITAIAEISKHFFYDRFFIDAMEFLFKVLDDYSDKDYNRLQLETFYCIAVILTNFKDNSITQPYLNKLLQRMISFQSQAIVFSSNGDTGKRLLIQSWKILVESFSEVVRPQLKEVITGVFEFIKVLLNDSECNELEGLTILEMLKVVLERFNSDFTPFIIDGIQKVIGVYSLNQESKLIRASCSRCIAVYMKAAEGNTGIAQSIAGILVKKVRETTSLKNNQDELNAIEIRILVSLIEKLRVDLFEEDQLRLFVNHLHFLLQKHFESQHKQDRNQIESGINQEIDDEDEEGQLDSLTTDHSKEIEEEVVSLIRVVVKMYREQSKIVIELIVNNVISKDKFRQKISSEEQILFGIRLINSVVISDAVANSNIGIQLASILKEQLKNNSYSIRQAAAKTILILAEHIPTSMMEHYAEDLMEELIASSHGYNKYPEFEEQDTQNKRKATSALEGSVAAIGTFIKVHTVLASQEILIHWLDNLPLLDEKEETRKQIVVLVELINQKSQLILCSSEIIEKAIHLFAAVLGTSIVFVSNAAHINEALKALQNTAYASKNWERITSTIVDKQRNLLNKIVLSE